MSRGRKRGEKRGEKGRRKGEGIEREREREGVAWTEKVGGKRGFNEMPVKSGNWLSFADQRWRIRAVSEAWLRLESKGTNILLIYCRCANLV